MRKWSEGLGVWSELVDVVDFEGLWKVVEGEVALGRRVEDMSFVGYSRENFPSLHGRDRPLCPLLILLVAE